MILKTNMELPSARARSIVSVVYYNSHIANCSKAKRLIKLHCHPKCRLNDYHLDGYFLE